MPVFSPSDHRKVLDAPAFDLIRGPVDAGRLQVKLAELVRTTTGLGVDTETTGLDPRRDRVRLVQVASPEYAVLVDLEGWRRDGERQVDWSRPGLAELKELLEGPSLKVLQNAAFDLVFLRGEGIDLGGMLFDTMIAAKIINNGTGVKNDLGSIVGRVLSVELPKELQKSDWSGELSEEQLVYAARDAIVLPRLAQQLKSSLQSADTGISKLADIFALEMRCLKPIALMQWHGFGFDSAGALELMETLSGVAETKMQELLEALDEAIRARYPEEPEVWLPREPDGSFNTRAKESGSIRLGTKKKAGFNPRSGQQMALRLQQAGVILRPDAKGKPSMDQNLLAFIKADFPLVAQYLEWKEQVTLMSAVEKLINSVGPDGRIHGSYRQMGTDTGRMSCVAGSTLLNTTRGTFRFDEYLPEDGDLVLTHRGRWQPVLRKLFKGRQPMVEVRTGQGDKLTCTGDHRVLTPSGWTRVADLCPGDLVVSQPELCQRSVECAADFGVLQAGEQTHNAPSSRVVRNDLSQRQAYYLNTSISRGVQGGEDIAVLSCKDGKEEPYVGQEWFPPSQLQRLSGGWLWLPHNAEWGGKTGICTSSGYGGSAWAERVAEPFACSPHRWGQDEQFSRQPLCIDTSGTPDTARCEAEVVSITPVGTLGVWDIEVAEDHSYAAGGFLNHNCAEPNLQQVPRSGDFRRLFQADPGNVLVVADFSQVELRVAAQLSGEERMLEAYRAGRDLHTETAALVTGKKAEDVTKAERTSAKICFSGDTEVLTESGWVRLDAYDNQQVAQYVLPAGVELNRKVRKPGPGYIAGLPPAWDGNCGAIEFVKPLHYDSFYSEDVWRAADRNIDIVATGNHHIFYLDAYGNARKEAFSQVVSPREFIAAGYCKKSADCLSSTESRLLAMIVADGSFKQAAGWVSLGFSKRRKIKRCGDLLEEAGITFKKSIASNGYNEPTTFFKFKLDEAPWLLDYVDKDKVLNHAACIRQVDALAYLCEAQYWDGIALGGAKRDRVIVGTTVRETADVMQAMAVTAGLPCTVHTEEHPGCTGGLFFRVSYAFRTTPTWRPSWNPERVEAQQVYCVQVPSELLVVRRNGKVCVQGNCNFGLLYGAGPATLQKQAVAQYGVDLSFAEAKELVNGFREAYPTLKKWQDVEGNKTTKAVTTKIGRRRILVGFNDKYTTRINTQVQGTAGDIAKTAIALLWRELKCTPEDEARLISMVHDEIVMEVRADQADVWMQKLSSAMETAGNRICIDVPIVAEASSGKTWADAK